ncbi:branched-chain amino acid ABC transporter permease [Ottowia thiooxydans]|uniref:Branched-chain amino acid transport system permease protein n=1 Tax=Ottowia thiooxydans TaxID=219182 RepID=A0ABV2Q8R7_9BURK
MSSLVMAQLINGCAIGMLYAVMAFGLSIIKGLLNVPNFAHGALFATGAYVCYAIANMGLPFGLALIGAFAVPALIGAMLQRFGLEKLAKADYLLQVLFLFGIALALEQTLVVIWGTSGVSLAAPSLFGGSFDLGFMRLPRYLVFVTVASAMCIAVLWFLIERTKLGSQVRAGIEKSEMARCLGINIKGLLILGFALGAGMAGLAGGIALPLLGANSSSGNDMMSIAFVVLVLGGLGSLYGSVVAGLLLGIVQSLSTLVAPTMSTLLLYVVMTLVLLVRPQGLFGER